MLANRQTTQRAICYVIVISLTSTSMGCQSLAAPPKFPGLGFLGAKAPDSSEAPNSVATAGTAATESTVQQVQYDAPGEEAPSNIGTTETAKGIFGRFTGRGKNIQSARSLYQEGDKLFRQASSEPVGQREKTFGKAAQAFSKSAEASPMSAIEQDALFMQGESLFFANELMEASETYSKLQQDHPRNRHNDQIAARLFSISRYWIDASKARSKSWIPFNFTDSSRPTLDADGHAIRLLDQIRYDDPTGRLADDATMAAAAEYIRQEKYEEADEFLTDIRETFGDSEHQFLAHLLGVRTKLKIYAGPEYSGLVLEEAKELISQTRTRFPSQSSETEHDDMLKNMSGEITYHEAERLAFRARYNEAKKEIGAAKVYYHKLLEQHGNTPHAEVARKRLQEIEGLPEVPTSRLSFLKKVFPDRQAKVPFELVGPSDADTNESTGSILR